MTHDAGGTQRRSRRRIRDITAALLILTGAAGLSYSLWALDPLAGLAFWSAVAVAGGLLLGAER